MTTQMEAVYIYGPTGKIAKIVNDITEYYHADHLGSTRLTTSEIGVKVTEIQYEPFGEQINTTEERYTFTGKELDDTGLYYYGARYYDPEIGRFLTRDPLQGEKEAPQTLNRYLYCLNNPLKYTDPTGNQSEDPQQIVEDVFDRLEDVDLDDLAEVQELIDAGNYLEALAKILDLLGFEYVYKGDGTLSVDIGKDEWYTMVPVTSLKVRGWDAHGATNNDNTIIFINFGLTSMAGEATLTVLHEVCHGLLGGTTPGDIEREHESVYFLCSCSRVTMEESHLSQIEMETLRST